MPKKLILSLSFLVFSSTHVLANSDKKIDNRLDMLIGNDTHKKYHDFFIKLQKSVLENDKENVSSMVDYPITVTVNHKEIDINNKKELLVNYDKIFNKNLIKTIANQKYSDLFIKDTGVMVGQYGNIWFSGICTVSDCSKFDIKIMQINS